MQRRLEYLRILTNGWDGEDALAPTDAAVTLAELVLSTPGNAIPLINGGVQIEWHLKGADVEIVISPEGVQEFT